MISILRHSVLFIGALACCAGFGVIAGDMSGGGGFGATNMYKLVASLSCGRCIDKSRWILLNSISASVNAFAITSISTGGDAATNSPKAGVRGYEFGTLRMFAIPINVTFISRAYTKASTSPDWYSINKSIWPISPRSDSLTFSSCEWEISRDKVRLTVSDKTDSETATLWIEISCEVQPEQYGPEKPLAVVQLAVLRSARDAIIQESRRLQDVAANHGTRFQQSDGIHL